jgi:hypothetical protein
MRENPAALCARLLDYANRHGHDFNYSDRGYCEPGYTDPDCGIIAFGNWNSRDKCDWSSGKRVVLEEDNTMPRIAEVLEKAGIEIEWEDEWETCSQCGKAFRTSPDSYGWQQHFWFCEDACEYVCADCVNEDPSDYLEYLEGNDRHCMTFDVDLDEHGYVELQSGFEHGLHHGQAADPQKIAAALRSAGSERFIFVLDSTGQFDVHFSVWVHKDELEGFKGVEYFEADKDCDISPARACEMALRDASRKMEQLPAIKVAACQPDGTAKVAVVTPQEFVDGRALDIARNGQ